MALEGIKTWYERNEQKISLFGIFLGFIVDSLTLRGVDRLPETVVLFVYLLITAVGIIVLQRLEEKMPVEQERGRTHFWTVFLMQFALGGLFSAFFIFYFRSAVFEISFPLLVILFGGLIFNELFKKKVSHLVFQSSVLFFALCSFSIFFVPTILKHISVWTFLLGLLFASLLFYVFMFVASKYIRRTFEAKRKKILLSASSILAAFILFYIGNIIPPLPLVMKDSGVYHSVTRTINGQYIVTKEKSRLFDWIDLRQTIHVSSPKPVYVWSAIYSPVKLNTTIIHSWKKFDGTKNRWVEVGDIPIQIVGGRNNGYRLYSVYPFVSEGAWSVDVKTATGQIMGRIKFDVKETPQFVELEEALK